MFFLFHSLPANYILVSHASESNETIPSLETKLKDIWNTLKYILRGNQNNTQGEARASKTPLALKQKYIVLMAGHIRELLIITHLIAYLFLKVHTIPSKKSR